MAKEYVWTHYVGKAISYSNQSINIFGIMNEPNTEAGYVRFSPVIVFDGDGLARVEEKIPATQGLVGFSGNVLWSATLIGRGTLSDLEKKAADINKNKKHSDPVLGFSENTKLKSPAGFSKSRKK